MRAVIAAGLLLGLVVAASPPSAAAAVEQCLDGGEPCVRVVLDRKVMDLHEYHTNSGAGIVRVYSYQGDMRITDDADNLTLFHTTEVRAYQVYLYPLASAPQFDSARDLNRDLGDQSVHFTASGSRLTEFSQSYRNVIEDPPIAELWLAHLEFDGPGAMDSGIVIPYIVEL